MTSSNIKSPLPHFGGKVKQLFQIPDGTCPRGMEWIPFFCVEARIDFNDVRTGFRGTMSLSKALEIYSDRAELLWTDDMIRDVDLSKTGTSLPDGDRLAVLPHFVDASFLERMENQFVQYLLRSFEITVYRNYDLNLYSFFGESRSDFHRRCRELFDVPKRQELEELHDVVSRKLERLKQKYLGAAEMSELEQTKSESRNRDAFSQCSERFTVLFSSAALGQTPSPESPQFSPGMQEFEERLLSLESEARQSIRLLSDSYMEKTSAIDEYILHPNLKDVHFVRSCILWIPKGRS